MGLASTSKAQLSFVEEVTFGVTPATAGKDLRMTGESLAYAIQTAPSSEINASRQVSDVVQVGASAQGGVNIELNYHEYDPFLEALLAGTFTTFGTNGVKAITSATFAKTANTITGAGTDFATIVNGQWISITGTAAVSAGVAREYRVVTATNTVLTLDTDTPIAADAAAIACNVCTSRLTNGVAALRSFSLQKYFSDVGQYFVYRGMSPSKLDLSFDTGSILKGSVSFMGADGARADAGFVTTPAVSQAFGVMNAVTGVGTVLLNGDLITGTYIKSAKISVDGKLRGQTAIGHLGNVGIGQGTFEIGGTLEMYLASGAIYDLALAGNVVSIQIPVMDVAKNGYAFIFNNVKLGVPTVQAGSKDADVMLSVPFTAVAPSSTDKMLIIDRFGAAAA